jgi:PAS domain S-box-containing protein
MTDEDDVAPADRVDDSAESAANTAEAAWHRVREALDSSERRYRHLVENSLGLICTHDLDGVILSINPAAAQSLGYASEDGIGRNLSEFLDPDIRHLFPAYLRRMREIGRDTGLMRLITRNGDHRVWMYQNVRYDESGHVPYVLGHAVDITDRVDFERTLREKDQALRRAYSELDQRVKNRTADLARANEALAFLAGVSEQLAPLLTTSHLLDRLRTLPVPFLADWTVVISIDEARNLQCAPGIHVDETQSARLSDLAALMSGAPMDSNGALSRAISSQRAEWMPATVDVASGIFPSESAITLARQLGLSSVTIVPVGIEHRTFGLALLVSGHREAFTPPEAAVMDDFARRVRLAADRCELYQQAQEANRLKDEFLSTLSHELRTPLNAIYGWTTILSQQLLDSATARAVGVIQRNAQAQIRLIEEVLDVSRIITGKMALKIEPLDVRTVVRAGVDSIRPTLDAKRIRLVDDLGDDPLPVVGDSQRLQQVVWNLMSNAAKFTASDGVITVTLRRQDDRVECEVNDTGIGIRREALPFVFERFRQVDASTTRVHGGLGLGLAIVKHIVELHGGSVHADSAGEGHGACFTIQLPTARRRSPDVPPVVPTREHAPSRLAAAQLAGRRVLVVEDDDDGRELIEAVLQSSGATVFAVASSQEAVASFVRADPDLVVADIGLPGEDGYTLLTRIQALARARNRPAPAVALTAYARASDRERALAAGFLKHLVKPIAPDELISAISEVLRST